MSYNRRFIILNKFDEKFCKEGATGYCKIEAKDDKANLTVFVQGLESFETRWKCDVFLISVSKGQFIPVIIGSINLEKGTGEFESQVNSKNVLSSGLTIMDFDIVSICVKNIQKPELSEMPLVGYYNMSIDKSWQNEFLKYLSQDIKKVEDINKEQSNTEENEYDNSFWKENINGSNYASFLKKGNIREINETLKKVKGIQEYNPFEKVKLKYKWWKVMNESLLENLFNVNAASSQINKHPLIKRMLHQTNHCMFGIVSDVEEKVRYIVFGFPATYSMKDQLSIGGFASFYPSAGYNKRKGEHGYWVIHIKLDDGSIVMTV